MWIALEYIGIGPFSYIRIDDTGDSSIPHHIILFKNFFTQGINYWFPYVACGVDRLAIDIKYASFTGILFGTFPGWLAYQILILIQIFLGGYFTYRISKDYLQISDVSSVCAGVIFALHFNGRTSYSLGIAGFPLILWAIEKIIDSQNKFRYLLVILTGVLYSFSSSLVTTLPFTLVLVLAWFIFVRRQGNIRYLFIFLIFCIVIFIFQFHNIWSLLLNADLSHRADRGLYATRKGPIGALTYFNIVLDGVTRLLNNKLALLLTFIGLVFSKLKSRLLLILFSFFLFCSIGTSVIKLLTFYFREHISFLRSFDFGRFYLITPFFAALSAALSLDLMRERLKNWKIERKFSEKILSWQAFNIIIIIIFAFLFYKNFSSKIEHITLWLYQGNYTYNYKSEELKSLPHRTKMSFLGLPLSIRGFILDT